MTEMVKNICSKFYCFSYIYYHNCFCVHFQVLSWSGIGVFDVCNYLLCFSCWRNSYQSWLPEVVWCHNAPIPRVCNDCIWIFSRVAARRHLVKPSKYQYWGAWAYKSTPTLCWNAFLARNLCSIRAIALH